MKSLIISSKTSFLSVYSRDMVKYVAICMGECSGTAVEMIIKAAGAEPLKASCGILVTGDLGVFRHTADDLGLDLPFSSCVSTVRELEEAEAAGEKCIFYSSSSIDISGFEYGKPTKETGIASYESVRAAVDLVCNGFADTLVTPSVSSIALGLAGYSENSITDLLSSFAESSRLTNMFLFRKANVFLLKYHGSVRDALDAVREEMLMDAIVNIESLFASNFFNSSKPIAVSALNPDIGDGEWFGPEEKEIIAPVIERCRYLGINAVGPVPVRDVYKRSERGDYSATLVYFRNELSSVSLDKNAVVVTWGLPFVRVGVTCGLEFEKAGRNAADIKNMVKALKLASELSDRRILA